MTIQNEKSANHFDYSQNRSVALTQQLVRIDSSDPGAYEKEIGEFIFSLFKTHGIDVRKEEVLPGRSNIIARIPGQIDDPALVFICHMDTVTHGEGWSNNPLSGHITNGRLYGRGSCDMKSGLACAINVFLNYARRRSVPRHTFLFIATVDEEDLMRGSEQAIASGWVTSKSWVLDMEPTDGRIRVAHKGRTWFELTVRGITAHASTPWKGEDAIAAMAEIITYIRRSIQDMPPHPQLGRSTVTFGRIQGGYQPYVVPDTCTVTIDMRLAPPLNTDTARELIETAVAQAQRSFPQITASLVNTGDRPCIEMDEQSFLLNKLRESVTAVTGNAQIDIFPGYTDTAVIAGKLGNHNCMSYGPGNLELAHKPDEYVPCEDILRCEKVLAHLADSILQ